jgi:radical SAM superfamily enzyme YgiQ (UPF0313 family)
MKVAFINPNIVSQKGDFFGTGIPYLPLPLLYCATAAKEAGHSVLVVDAFGENPKKCVVENNFVIQGLDVAEVLGRISPTIDVVVVFSGMIPSFERTLEIIRALKSRNTEIKVLVIENTQAVFAVSLRLCGEQFLLAGADVVILGEPENRILDAIKCAKSGELSALSGIMSLQHGKAVVSGTSLLILDLDKLPFPDFSLLPIENYWSLGFSHAPLSSEKYLPLLTSRGCPHNCGFCITPLTNQRRWRARSPENVVAEIEKNIATFGVREFHIEDLNPCVDQERMAKISSLLVGKGLNIILKIASGTRIDSLSAQTLQLMRTAGFGYISFSPESGSNRVLGLMAKDINLEALLDTVKNLSNNSFVMQACFVIGFPGETDADRRMTKMYVRKLMKLGVDEIALFMFTPLPGAREYKSIEGYSSIRELTFSPTWRKDYKILDAFRRNLYMYFLIWKTVYQPVKTVVMLVHLIRRRFSTKMEMTLYRLVFSRL